MSVDIWLPIAKRIPISVPSPNVSPYLMRHLAGAFGRGALPVSEIAQAFGGRTAMPTKPILVYGPDNRSMTFIVGGGETEAGELQDMAEAVVEQQTQRQKNNYMAEQRERRGLLPREKVDSAIREGLAAQAEHQRRNPSEYHRPPPTDRSWVKALPEIELTDRDREEAAAWLAQ